MRETLWIADFVLLKRDALLLYAQTVKRDLEDGAERMRMSKEGYYARNISIHDRQTN